MKAEHHHDSYMGIATQAFNGPAHRSAATGRERAYCRATSLGQYEWVRREVEKVK